MPIRSSPRCESCRSIGLPIREYLTAVLPGLADRYIHDLVELTPTADAAKAAR